MKKAFYLRLMLIFWISAAQGQDQRAETLVKKVSVDFVQAWNEHRAERLGALFEADADFVNYVGMWWKSRGDVVQGHEHVFKGFLRQSLLKELSTTVRWLTSDIAVSRLHWELSGQLSPSGEPVPTRTGRLMLVIRMGSQGWRVVAAQNTDVVPAKQLLSPDGTRAK